MSTRSSFKIVKDRRDYNAWIAAETLEDYALRFAPKSFRRWPEWLVASTSIGGLSFLALEAIGGSLAIRYGFANSFWAIIVVGVIIFLTGLPIAYYAAKYNVDIDLLTRGAGFGYLGSTITSLIYASFTFIFFALEAAIMAQALELYFHLPLYLGYIVCSLVIIPLVFFGVTLINKLQLWTQPIWITLIVLPYLCIFYKEPDALTNWVQFAGETGSASFDPLLFGAAATTSFSLIAQIGEQVDYLRFLPDKQESNKGKWWLALVLAGPGWVLIGCAKQLGGAFLASLAIAHGVSLAKANEPTQMYLVGFEYVFSNPEVAMAVTTLFVLVSQIKINVTNAYAGSLAWSNFFSRLTRSHPGRVVWLVFNVLIALLMMELGVFSTLEAVLGLYSNVAIAWVGALVADLVVNKPLGLSPPYIEFKRAHLYSINPVGFGSMLIASLVSMAAFVGAFGSVAKAFAAFIALGLSFVLAPAIAVLTKGKYYIAREDDYAGYNHADHNHAISCCICEKEYEPQDMAFCPIYSDSICSLCCSLDSCCHDACKITPISDSQPSMPEMAQVFQGLFQEKLSPKLGAKLLIYLALFLSLCGLLGAIFGFVYYQRVVTASLLPEIATQQITSTLVEVYAILSVLIGVGAWWLILTQESRQLAETQLQEKAQQLEQTLHNLQQAEAQLIQTEKMVALGGLVAGIAHEINTPIGIGVTAASLLMEKTIAFSERFQNGTMKRSELERFLDMAQQSSQMTLSNLERAAELIQSFKQVAVDQSSESKRLFNFKTYLEEILLQLSPKLKATKHSVDVQGDPHLTLNSYPGALSQIVTNLVMNSLLHAYESEEQGHIALTFNQTEENVIFEYADDGIGIISENLGKIFEPFFTTKRGQGGSGLGLHIVYNLVTRKLGGTIQCKSQPGKGTTFVIKLPNIQNQA
ncbi:MAG: histidine kinase [Drouetiella hepatica Uher 2000/2452]|jgi:signal transduction histidine kinase/purine-cytosine permease-like protein|uniref:histidine kinase n=1 Tax=Drouetiella hepatica Uher 2000/2452 TaxID=904376 RepID=A0A951QE19_9CYAN|nr:histidine kinase [Drouetiella hepatica Uher 2000/2452]